MKNFIWFERYRPQVVEQMVLTPETRNLLETFVKSREIPHLLLYGRPGSGKTTIARILISLLPCSKLELNASGKDRGVEMMRGAVVDFASSMPSMGKRLKIVFMDECDGLTNDAQNSLRNTLEKYSATCRFILTANNVNKIIDPIRSRCVEIPLVEFGKENAVAFCSSILQNEGVKFTVQNVQTVVDRYYPDLRTTINNLQRASITGKLDISTLVSAGVDPAQVLSLIMAGKVTSLRTLYAGTADFMFLYKWLFDHIGDYAGNNAANVAYIICTHLSYDSTIPDREISFTTAAMEIMDALGVKVSFNA